jgi:hypothetical protein
MNIGPVDTSLWSLVLISSIFWDMTRVVLWRDISEEYIISIFRVKEQSERKISTEQILLVGCFMAIPCLTYPSSSEKSVDLRWALCLTRCNFLWSICQSLFMRAFLPFLLVSTDTQTNAGTCDTYTQPHIPICKVYFHVMLLTASS